MLPIKGGNRQNPEPKQPIVLCHGEDAVPEEGSNFGRNIRCDETLAVDQAILLVELESDRADDVPFRAGDELEFSESFFQVIKRKPGAVPKAAKFGKILQGGAPRLIGWCRVLGGAVHAVPQA